MVRLWFDKGTLLLKGNVGTPYGKWDVRVGCFRIKALHYRDVLAYFEESQISFEDSVQQLPPSVAFLSGVSSKQMAAKRKQRCSSFAHCRRQDLYSSKGC
jgi:hypothetical protein